MLEIYRRKVNIHYNLWRKFRDILSAVNREYWPEDLKLKLETELLPLIDQLDYTNFYRKYQQLEQERMKLKYGPKVTGPMRNDL